MSISNVIIKLLFVTFDIVILHEEVRLVEQVVGAPLILNLTILNLSLRTIIINIIAMIRKEWHQPLGTYRYAGAQMSHTIAEQWQRLVSS